MNEQTWLADEFQSHRPRLRSVAYRMLGSLSEADDAIQEAWLRVSRADATAVENLGGWLTTIVARVCLNMLQSRKSRREESLDLRQVEPIVSRADATDPEHEALLGDSVGLALLVVLETLPPAERVAFVLHDVFAVSFDEIAPIVGRSPAAARQLASRARRRVQGVSSDTDADPRSQRVVVDAFLRAARGGDIQGLLAVLDPDIVLHNDRGPVFELRGAQTIASQAVLFAQHAQSSEPVLVNHAPGVLARAADGRPLSLMAFTVVGQRITAIHVINDRDHLARLRLPT